MENTKFPGRAKMYPRLHAVPVLLCLVTFGIGIFTHSIYCALVLFALMLSGLCFKIPDVFLLGLTCGLASLLWRIEPLRMLWPLPIASALAAGLIIGKLARFTRGELAWIRRGDCGGAQIAVVAVVAIVSGIALISWYAIVKPDVSDLVEAIPRVHPVALIAIGFFFSIANGICEEFLWRGMIYGALERTIASGTAVICIQALSFGLAHIHGFPRGVSGIVLASIYGTMLGYVRQRAKGMLAPIVAHVFADLVIYAILASVGYAGRM